MLPIKKVFRGRKKKGLTLLEIVVSLGLIALFTVPVGHMVFGTVKINKAAEDKQQASAILQEVVESIKALDEMPKLGSEAQDLGNGVEVKATGEYDYEDSNGVRKKGVRYSITSTRDTDYGFSVVGEILQRQVIDDKVITKEESTVDLNTLIDGVVLFDKKNKITSQVSAEAKTMTIEEALNKELYNVYKNNKNGVGIEFDANNTQVNIIVHKETNKNKIVNLIPSENALLLIIDNNSDKLRVDLEDADEVDNFTVYLVNKNAISSLSDIIVNYIECTEESSKVKIKPVLSTSENTVVKGISMYTLKLQAIKKGKEIENISLTFVK